MSRRDLKSQGFDVLNAIHGHIVDEAQLIGTYTLNPALAAEPARKPRKKTA